MRNYDPQAVTAAFHERGFDVGAGFPLFLETPEQVLGLLDALETRGTGIATEILGMVLDVLEVPS